MDRVEKVDDVRLRIGVIENGGSMSSSFSDTIRSFRKHDFCALANIIEKLKNILQDARGRKLSLIIAIQCISLISTYSWSTSTDSMALKAFMYLTLFDILGLCISLLNISLENCKVSPSFTFGYDRFQVLAIFSSTILVQIGCLFILKECLSRVVKQPDIHTGRLLVGTVVVLFSHIVATVAHNNKCLSHVIQASSSSWLQEHVADICHSICHVIPGFSAFLLPRINPLTLVAVFGSTSLFVAHFLIDVEQYEEADTIGAMCIAIIMSATMFPMCVYTGNILLQTMPTHIVAQLDKCLREAATLDGVLEFRNEHFWTVSFAKLGGSLHVRIRRDANEQLVLAHLLERLNGLVPVITIQVFKDDWTRTSTLQILSDTDLSNMKLAPRAPPTSAHMFALQGPPPAVNQFVAFHSNAYSSNNH